MFKPFNNEQPCPERPAALTAPGVKVYYSDYIFHAHRNQEVKAVYLVDSRSFELKSDRFRWVGCTVNSISEVQRSSPEGHPAVGSGFAMEEGYYFLVTEDDSDHRRFKDCLFGKERAYLLVRNFVQGSEKIGHEIVELTFNSNGEVIKAEVDVSAYSVEVVNPPVDFSGFTESTTEIEEILERIENLQAEICNEEARIQKLREFFALADELGYAVVKTESQLL